MACTHEGEATKRERRENPNAVVHIRNESVEKRTECLCAGSESFVERETVMVVVSGRNDLIPSPPSPKRLFSLDGSNYASTVNSNYIHYDSLKNQNTHLCKLQPEITTR
jgi:hypothetical protein